MKNCTVGAFALLTAFIMLSVPMAAVYQADASDPHEEFMKSLNIQKVEDYLYTAEYSGYDYEKGEQFAKYYYKPSAFGCSAMNYDSKIIGRNFDFFYDEECDFVVKTPNANGRYATISVCNLATTNEENMLKNDFVQSGEYSELYEYLPFFVLDGMNEKGLFVETNLNTNAYGKTSGTNPDLDSICVLTLGRHLLDKAANVGEALDIINSHNIYAPDTKYMSHELHMMIADGNRTVVVEFVNNAPVIIEDPKVVTNFHLWGEKPPAYSNGIERYNLLLGLYPSVEAADDKVAAMMDAMRQANYTNLFNLDTDPRWYTEICGSDEYDFKVEASYNEDGTIEVTPIDKEKFDAFFYIMAEDFEHRSRGDETWQTMHTCVYDLENKTLSISAQEHTDVYHYSLDKTTGDSTLIYVAIAAGVIVLLIACFLVMRWPT